MVAAQSDDLFNENKWHIFYKDIEADDPLWHLYTDTEHWQFKTKKAAKAFVDYNYDMYFDGCKIKILKTRAYV